MCMLKCMFKNLRIGVLLLNNGTNYSLAIQPPDREKRSPLPINSIPSFHLHMLLIRWSSKNNLLLFSYTSYWLRLQDMFSSQKAHEKNLLFQDENLPSNDVISWFSDKVMKNICCISGDGLFEGKHKMGNLRVGACLQDFQGWHWFGNHVTLGVLSLL